jgi:dienelactone hydrolase
MSTQRSWWSVAAAAAVLGSCTHLHVNDCPDGQVLGKDVNRFRTASYRTTLDNPPAAAKRFLLLAAMSGLAYWHEGSACPHEDKHLSKQDADELKAILRAASPDGAWEPVRFDPALKLPTECQDDIGLFFSVWRRPGLQGPDDVVIAFRGTSNRPDWLYGNLWWFTRFFLSDNQYARSTRHVQTVLAHLDEQARLGGRRRPRVVATGHSLGGGLAQHALYNFTEIRQAVVFAPSAVTGYVASRRGREVLECDCDLELGTEARIIRVYESDEILSNLRIWHKVFFPSHLQIQEVRFAFYQGGDPVRAHSMRDLARSLERKSKEPSPPSLAAQRWYASASAACTRKIEDAQNAACRAVAGTCTPTQ